MRRLLFTLFLLANATPLLAADKAPPKPLSPQETVKRMQLPPGFKATVFAAEPDIVQPMAMTFDDRGRLWVVECLSYPDWITPDGHIINKRKKFKPKDKSRVQGRDRITILEDTDGDGKHDKRTVFYNKGKNFTGIEYGFGGVFVTAPPYLLFIPDKNRDDKPDGPPQILLDGWDLTAGHNAVNGLTWGPDGWLYGCNGILSNSNVGVPASHKKASRKRQRPESPKKQNASGASASGAKGAIEKTPVADAPGSPSKRTKMNCGVWRYHPTRKLFEVVAHGTTNPWGLDFNEEGEMFITNCVIKHVFHVVPGGHYKRMFGQDITPNVYGLMESCADHIHWGGGKWTSSRGGHGVHDKPGGGHAHAGCMIYLGDNWPAKYRGKLFTCNIHGNRVNMDVLNRKGSGYVASHGADFLKVPDPWFRGLEMKYGPDGGVYITDWSDTGECHDYEDIHRENGRIYKITFGDVKKWKGDLQNLDSKKLAALLLHKNHWFSRRASHILADRARRILKKNGRQGLELDALASAGRLAKTDGEINRALWAYHSYFPNDVFPEVRPSLAKKIAAYGQGALHESCRVTAIRIVIDARAAKDIVQSLTVTASQDRSPSVRLALACCLQRLPLKDRWPIAEALVAHAEDAKDANIPLMIWYGIEPAVSKDRVRAIQLLKKTKIPLIRQYIARRLAESAK